jgi:hypothetical protein
VEGWHGHVSSASACSRQASSIYPQSRGQPRSWLFDPGSGLHPNFNPDAARAHRGCLTVVVWKKHGRNRPGFAWAGRGAAPRRSACFPASQTRAVARYRRRRRRGEVGFDVPNDAGSATPHQPQRAQTPGAPQADRYRRGRARGPVAGAERHTGGFKVQGGWNSIERRSGHRRR